MNLASFVRAFLVGLVAVAFSACSGPPMPPLADAPYADVAFPLRGVPDPGADPAVVLLDLDGAGQCSGALLASDVVLTARRCLLVAPGDASVPGAGARRSPTTAISPPSASSWATTPAPPSSARAAAPFCCLRKATRSAGPTSPLLLLDSHHRRHRAPRREPHRGRRRRPRSVRRPTPAGESSCATTFPSPPPRPSELAAHGGALRRRARRPGHRRGERRGRRRPLAQRTRLRRQRRIRRRDPRRRLLEPRRGRPWPRAP